MKLLSWVAVFSFETLSRAAAATAAAAAAAAAAGGGLKMWGMYEAQICEATGPVKG